MWHGSLRLILILTLGASMVSGCCGKRCFTSYYPDYTPHVEMGPGSSGYDGTGVGY